MTPIQSPNPATITVPTQRVVWAVTARNNGEFPVVTGGKVVLTFSSNDIIIHKTSATDNAFGLAKGNTTAFGSFYDTVTNTWHFGSLGVGTVNEKVLFIETSLPAGTDLLTDLPITLTKVISVNGITDSLLGNNTQIDTLFAPVLELECAPAAGPQNGSCRCSVATNDTPCNYGQTIWEIVPGSFENVDEDMLDFDPATGEYTKHLINPTIPGSFQYVIKCKVAEGPGGTYGPFGPATETIYPFYVTGNDFLDSVSGLSFTPGEISKIKTDPRYSGFTTQNIETSQWYTLRDINGDLVSAILVLSRQNGQSLTIGPDGGIYNPIPLPPNNECCCDCSFNLIPTQSGAIAETNCDDIVWLGEDSNAIWEIRLISGQEDDWELLDGGKHNKEYNNGAGGSYIRVRYTINGCEKISNIVTPLTCPCWAEIVGLFDDPNEIYIAQENCSSVNWNTAEWQVRTNRTTWETFQIGGNTTSTTNLFDSFDPPLNINVDEGYGGVPDIENPNLYVFSIRVKYIEDGCTKYTNVYTFYPSIP